MTVLVDDPIWPAHGRLWAHLVSDEDLPELHAFARRNDVPERAFDLDLLLPSTGAHYCVNHFIPVSLGSSRLRKSHGKTVPAFVAGLTGASTGAHPDRPGDGSARAPRVHFTGSETMWQSEPMPCRAKVAGP